MISLVDKTKTLKPKNKNHFKNVEFKILYSFIHKNKTPAEICITSYIQY